MAYPVVMVVDDEPGMLALFDTWLKKHGFAVVKAHGAEAALHLASSFRPDLFLVDLLMPNIDGIELCRMLRAIPHVGNTPIIIITAYENNGSTIQQSKEAGADALLSKTAMTDGNLLSELQSVLSLNA